MIRRTNAILFVILFLLPLAVVAAYQLAMASDRYHSESSLIITEERAASPDLDLSIIGLPAPGGDKDALVVLEFIQSLDMLQFLDGRLALRQHYSGAEIDLWSRLSADASLEDFHDYMENYLSASYDTDSGIIRIHAEAFDRGFAQKLVDAILLRAQEFVDHLNARVTAEQTQFFENQLAESEKRLRDVKAEMLQFQRRHRLMSTESEASLVTTNIGEIEKQLLLKQGELSARLKELNESSPVIQVLRSEIETLQGQLAGEKERLSGGTSGAVSELDAQFREIEFNLEFLTGVYKSNLTQLEKARIDAVQRLKYLIVVTEPSRADSSLYPDRPYIIGTAAMILIMVFFIVSLLVAIIREHA